MFPDGVVPSGLLRWVTLGMAAVGAVWITGALGIAVSTIVHHNVHVDGGGNLLTIDNPRDASKWWGVVDTLIFPLSFASLVLWGVAQVPKYRRATGDRRVCCGPLMGDPRRLTPRLISARRQCSPGEDTKSLPPRLRQKSRAPGSSLGLRTGPSPAEINWQPQRDSNPCLHLERVVS